MGGCNARCCHGTGLYRVEATGVTLGDLSPDCDIQETVEELMCALSPLNTVEDEVNRCAQTRNQLNEQGCHGAACRERVRDSGVCSIHWSVERDINGQRHRGNTDALDETRKRAHTAELPSSSKRENPRD